MDGGSRSKTPSSRWNLRARTERSLSPARMSPRTASVGEKTTPTVNLTETANDLDAANPGAAAGRAAPETTWPTASRRDRRSERHRDHRQRGRPGVVRIVRKGNARSRPGARGFAGRKPDRHRRLVTWQRGELSQSDY